MTKQLLHSIYWGELGYQTYLYGSSMTEQEGCVVFENYHFPTGKPIKRWLSQLNFQAERRSPSLPLLQPGKTYRLHLHARIEPQGAAYLQLVYFNRQGEEIGEDMLREEDEGFTYPLDAFSYTLTLIGAGCERLVFERIDLYACEEGESPLFPRAARGYYGEGRYPVDIQFVSSLIERTKREEHR